MNTLEKQNELRAKIIVGLEKVYERLIEFKKTEEIILGDNER